VHRYLSAALAAALVFATSAAVGATRYVTDELRISVRTGAGTQYRIIEVIGSGTRLETLETSGEWTRVRTEGNETGWVRSQYLTEQPIAADRLETVRSDLQDANDRIDELEATLAETRSDHEDARERIETLSGERDALQARLQEAERGLELHDENERLREQTDELEQRVAQLREETQALAERGRREWFMIGAGVLLGGILFGIIVTRIPWRRRRDRMF
jgi:SH3 domain protein